MSEFEKDLANVIGSFMEVNLDCVEKQNQEIEQLQQERDLYKEVIEEVREYINTNTKEEYENIEVDEHFGNLLQILDKAKGDNKHEN